MNEKNMLKTVSADVPAGILPPGHTGILYDIKVSGWTSDDEIYSKNPNIRKMVSCSFPFSNVTFFIVLQRMILDGC